MAIHVPWASHSLSDSTEISDPFEVLSTFHPWESVSAAGTQRVSVLCGCSALVPLSERPCTNSPSESNCSQRCPLGQHLLRVRLRVPVGGVIVVFGAGYICSVWQRVSDSPHLQSPQCRITIRRLAYCPNLNAAGGLCISLLSLTIFNSITLQADVYFCARF
jgi:hypothetical protein